MNVLKGILIVIALLFMLLMVAVTPMSIIGIVVFLIGLFLRGQKRKGKISFSKSGWIVAAGIVLSLIMGMVFVDSSEVENNTNKTKVAAVSKEKKAEIAEKKAEAEKKKLADEKAKADAEEQKLAEEKAAKEQQEALKQQERENEASNLGLELVTVGRVVDGDTIVTTDGRKIRFIGVNTPESTTKKEEYGKEASDYTTSKLTGKQVWIQKDVSETDRYNRLLRIIWLSIPTNDMDESEIRTKMFNADLVLNGYAQPSTYPPDVKYSEYFVKFSREAREAGTGLWAFGNEGTTKGDSLDSAAKTNNSGSTPSGGSTTSGSSSTEKEFFKNCTEMRKVYPKGVPSTHPAYESKHDRDKDEWACEQ